MVHEIKKKTVALGHEISLWISRWKTLDAQRYQRGLFPHCRPRGEGAVVGVRDQKKTSD